MNTGQAIRSIREGLKESQQAFSNRFRVSLMTVSRWEADRFTPEPGKLLRLAAMARESGLGEAADVLYREAGALIGELGPEMLQAIHKAFFDIETDLYQVMLNPGMSAEDRERRFQKIRESAAFGKETAAELLSIAPHLRPKT